MINLAFISARGGSKRIPEKNIKEFCDKPILTYSIEAALECKRFDEVMVSTDSQKIAHVAVQYGAKVPFFRSRETSDDYATTAQVLLEVLSEYEKCGHIFDTICCIYPTAPFVTAEKLQHAFDCMEREDADAVVSVVQYSFPPQRAFVIQDRLLQYQYPQYATARSQDLEPIYHDCGQFYLCKVKSFRLYKSLIVPKTVPLIMPEIEVQDIDNISDWEIAEIKYQYMKERRQHDDNK